MHVCMCNAGVGRFCIVLRMRLAKSDGNSFMASFLCRCVKDWLLSTAYEDTDAVSLRLSGALNVFCLASKH